MTFVSIADEDFALALRDLNTVPTAVLENPELLALLLPLLRADFSVYERYQFKQAEPLSCPLTLLGGESDPLVQPDMLAAWAEHTTQPGELHLFPGDHFYVQAQQTAVWRVIQQTCL